MSKYNVLIGQLEKKGIVFKRGLSQVEIEKAQQRYQICFPASLCHFYREAFPVSDGFYNWRDFSDDNMKMIEKSLAEPKKAVLEELDDIDWPSTWGEEPPNPKRIIIEKVAAAPQLIPIYNHRYISSYMENAENPVFSLQGIDIIYYGENLYSYLETEFGIREYSSMDLSKIEHVPFWSDLI